MLFGGGGLRRLVASCPSACAPSQPAHAHGRLQQPLRRRLKAGEVLGYSSPNGGTESATTPAASASMNSTRSLQGRLQRLLGLEATVGGDHGLVVGAQSRLAQQAAWKRPPDLGNGRRVVFQQLVARPAGPAPPAPTAAHCAAGPRTSCGRCGSAPGAPAPAGCARRAGARARSATVPAPASTPRMRSSCARCSSRGRAQTVRATPSRRWRISPAAFLVKVMARISCGARAVEQRAQDARDQHPGLAGAGAGFHRHMAPRIAGDLVEVFAADRESVAFVGGLGHVVFAPATGFSTPPIPPRPFPPPPGREGEPDLASGFWIRFYGTNVATTLCTPAFQAYGRRENALRLVLPRLTAARQRSSHITMTVAEKLSACRTRSQRQRCRSVAGAKKQFGLPFPPRRGCKGAGGIGGGYKTAQAVNTHASLQKSRRHKPRAAQNSQTAPSPSAGMARALPRYARRSCTTPWIRASRTSTTSFCSKVFRPSRSPTLT